MNAEKKESPERDSNCLPIAIACTTPLSHEDTG